MNVLVVNADRDENAAIERALLHAGVSGVQSVTSVKEALRQLELSQLRGERPVSVFVSLELRGGGALRLIEAMRDDARYNLTRLLCWTSRNDPVQNYCAQRAGADTIIYKPLARGCLLDALAGLWSRWAPLNAALMGAAFGATPVQVSA